VLLATPVFSQAHAEQAKEDKTKEEIQKLFGALNE